MRQPHFRKFRRGGPKDPPPTSGEGLAQKEKLVDGEVVIRANMVFLGSAYPRRLRVVCFEDPPEPYSPTAS
jgi:hypothetical protein